MTPLARTALNRAFDIVRNQAHGQDPTQVFNVDPRIAQSIEDRIQQQNDFLQAINYTAVQEISGDVLHIDGDATLTKRTSTMQPNGTFRRHTDPTGLVDRNYQCVDIEQDSLITWDKIDSWAHLPKFYQRLRAHIMRLQARDNLRIMWNGQFAAPDTDPSQYDMLQDVQRGFIQYLIEKYPENLLGILPDAAAPGGYTIDPIHIGPGAGANGFETMDEAAFHLKDKVIDKLYRKNKKLRILAGDTLSYQEKARIIGAGNVAPTENLASKLMLQSTQYGELNRMESDEFPEHGIFVTDPKNLSHYWQRSSVRSKYDIVSHDHKGMKSYYYKRSDNVIEYVEGCAGIHPDAVHVPTGYDAAGKATGWAPHADVWKAV